MNSKRQSKTEIELPCKTGLTEVEAKKILLAEFLREVGLMSGRTISEELTETFWKRIQHYGSGQIRKGLEAYMRNESRFPWVADLIAHIEEQI